jgi:hypothetical protein
MAWAEKTFFNVEDPPHEKSSESEDKINRLLKELPPFMKLTSRKARKILVRYEELKERHIENLRNNQVFKFVMKVAGFTSERIEKFWKGSDISPFMERYTPQNIKITKEDLDILVLRAREHALSDLHQFCTEIAAIPMYRPNLDANATIDPDESVDISDHTALKEPVTNGSAQGTKRMIFNMSDAEFQVFCKKFLLMKKTLDKAYGGSNDIEWYLLTSGSEDPTKIEHAYAHTRVFNKDEKQKDTYDNNDFTNKQDNDNNAYWTWMNNTPLVHWDKTTAEFWFQRYIAKWLSGDSGDGKTRDGPDRSDDLEEFREKYNHVFNNLRLDKSSGKWMRDLTGLRLTKMIRGRTRYKDSDRAPNSNLPVGVTRFEAAEKVEGKADLHRPQDMPTEVPLDFVRPIFNERFAYWKHELVLGEYEKRSMQEADKWLQMTPWAIGKIYLQPSIYAHMQEAHIAITKKWKKFQHMTLEDWLNSEEHAFFFSKLVALCIKTSDILSGKKYGLDKMYMRINLEKRRVMYSIGKLDAPSRRRKGVSTLATSQKMLRDWSVARERGDAEAAARIQASIQRVPF